MDESPHALIAELAQRDTVPLHEARAMAKGLGLPSFGLILKLGLFVAALVKIALRGTPMTDSVVVKVLGRRVRLTGTAEVLPE